MLSMRCSKCSHDNASDAGFCESCGTRLEISCVACGTANSTTARFCKRCGAPLDAPEATSVGGSQSADHRLKPAPLSEGDHRLTGRDAGSTAPPLTAAA